MKTILCKIMCFNDNYDILPFLLFGVCEYDCCDVV